MPLVAFQQMMADADAGRYAVGYFESWNLESLLAVADAAEATRSPVILGFSGIYLTHPKRTVTEPLSVYAAMGLEVCRKLSVPACLIFNESPDFGAVLNAVDFGFNMVMYSDEGDVTERVKKLCGKAHAVGVAVEAELAALQGVGGDLTARPGDLRLTDPGAATRFVKETGVDALAVNIGQLHLHGREKVRLDLDRLEQLRKTVRVPLVLHGASSVAENDLEAAIQRGIRKINVGSVLKQTCFRAMRDAPVAPDANPYEIIGSGLKQDVLVAGRVAMQRKVEELMRLFRSAGKGRTMTGKIVIPALGGTGANVTIQEWLVKEGDVVRQGQPLFTVESEKAVVEVEAFRNGRIEKILAPNGTEVAIGQAVAWIGDAAELPPPAKAAPVAAPRTPARRVESTTSAPVWTPKKPATGALLEAYRKMVLIRHFEDHLYQLFLQGLVPGTLHQYQGQEAVAVGVCAALRNEDIIFSTHRPVGHFLAKGCSPRAIAAELWGKATGCAGGKGGQMHLCDMSVGAPPSNAIVGANIPIATGAAIGFKLRGLDRVAVSFFGDGSANIGAAHEGFNLAAAKDAPVIFVCENNLYGASTHQSLATRVENIADRAAGYGMPGVVVDGMDVTAVYKAAAQAVSRARSGHGPTLIECKTYEFAGHSRGDPGGYRTKDEIAQWKARDPVPLCRTMLVEQHGIKAEQLDEIEQRCQAEVEEAVKFAQASPDPLPESLYENVFAVRRTDIGRNPLAVQHEEPTEVGTTNPKKMSMVEALRDAMRVAMRADPSVFVLGEDVGVAGGFGGGFTVTLGLSDEFGHDRIMDTPISEIAIVGAAVGAAMTGMRPIAEMQYGDFVFCAMDQVVNQAAKMCYMSNGQVSVPMVLRLPVGASSRGAQHGQCTETFFMHTPGLKVVCPSNAYDAKGLLLASIRDGNPVVFLEHKLLYGAKGGRKEKASIDSSMEVPEGAYEVDLGTVVVRREGTDLTILANMLMLHRALAAAEELEEEGLHSEVIDMRCLAPLDMETVKRSVAKTKRALIVEEDNLTGGWGAEVAARLAELGTPTARLAAPDTPLPCAPSLEREYVPSIERIIEQAHRLVRTR